ncbi:hypothetical protein ABKN59_007393 [Abortiporus biennis]
MSEPIVFYDIPRAHSTFPWSPNTWHTRYALNIKGIPYRTELVEFPDIEPVLKKIGAAPSTKWADGRPQYTVPAIHDPSTGVTISDSDNIIEYLEKQYPSPSLVPKGSLGLIMAFRSAFTEVVGDQLFALAIAGVTHHLSPRSAEYFRRTREEIFGKKLEDIILGGIDSGSEGAEKCWTAAQDGLNTLASWYNKNEALGKSLYLFGDSVTYADVLVAARLLFIREILGKDSKGWERIKSFDGGRWERFLNNFEKYHTNNS